VVRAAGLLRVVRVRMGSTAFARTWGRVCVGSTAFARTRGRVAVSVSRKICIKSHYSWAHRIDHVIVCTYPPFSWG